MQNRRFNGKFYSVHQILFGVYAKAINIKNVNDEKENNLLYKTK